jgi:hypothetical protein
MEHTVITAAMSSSKDWDKPDDWQCYHPLSTYLGGEKADFGRGIAVDSLKNNYVTGDTFSEDFPIISLCVWRPTPWLK